LEGVGEETRLGESLTKVEAHKIDALREDSTIGNVGEEGIEVSPDSNIASLENWDCSSGRRECNVDKLQARCEERSVFESAQTTR